MKAIAGPGGSDIRGCDLPGGVISNHEVHEEHEENRGVKP
jgi:hypothetical protein